MLSEHNISKNVKLESFVGFKPGRSGTSGTYLKWLAICFNIDSIFCIFVPVENIIRPNSSVKWMFAFFGKWIWWRPNRFIHHGQVFTIIVGLKHGLASIIFEKYTGNTPNVNFIIPRKTINHFGSSIMSRTNDFGMMFPEYACEESYRDLDCEKMLCFALGCLDITDWFRLNLLWLMLIKRSLYSSRVYYRE